MRYIEYEMRLERLRALRADRLGIKKTDAQYGPSMRRLHQLFQRATKKYSGDLELWMQWVDFSKEHGSNNVLSKSIGKALLLHPSVSSLWILAADWEYSNNANIVGARVLMLRGIRGNDMALELWREYFRLEMVYLNKILQRLALVKKDASKPSAGEGDIWMLEEEPEEAPSVATSGKDGEEPRAAGVDALPAEELEKIADSAFVKGGVPLAVFTSALQHPRLLKGLVQEAWKFFELAQQLNGPVELLDKMRALLREHYAQEPAYWKLVASQFSTLDELQAVLAESRQYLPTNVAQELALLVLAAWPDVVLAQCEQANASGGATPNIFNVWIALLCSRGDVEEAVDVGQRAIAAWPTDSDCWFHYLTAVLVKLKRDGVSDEAVHGVRHIFRDALQQLACDATSLHVRSLYLRFLFAFGERLTPVKVLRVVVSVSNEVVLSQLAELALDLAFRSWDLDTCRELCGSILDAAPSLAVFSKCLEWETDLEKRSLLFEDCVERFPQEEDLWIAWMRHEEACMNLEKAGRIHWRGRRTLKGEHLTRFLELASGTADETLV